MLSIRRTSAIAILFALSALLALAPAAPGSEQAGIVLRIQTPNPRVLLGEPVTIIASLADEGDEPIVVSPIMVLEASFLKLWVRDPGGNIRRCQPFALATVVCLPVLLYPGQSVAETYTLLWNWDGRHAFPTAGRYEVSATFDQDTRTLRSGGITIEVLEPQGLDAEAFPLVFADDSAQFLQVQSYHHHEGMANLRKLLSDYPNCAYAPYATYALAHRAAQEGPFSQGPGTMKRRWVTVPTWISVGSSSLRIFTFVRPSRILASAWSGARAKTFST